MTGGGQVIPYAELGVARDASSEEIRRAYRQVARRHHPDVSREPGGPERFAAAARAYEILNDPAARARYDNRFPGPVPIRRSPKARPAVGWRAVLELIDREAHTSSPISDAPRDRSHAAHRRLRSWLTGEHGRVTPNTRQRRVTASSHTQRKGSLEYSDRTRTTEEYAKPSV